MPASDKGKSKQSAKGAAKSAKGQQTAEAAKAAADARKSMLPTPGGVASVDLDVDPTVITTPSTAPDHPVGEDLAQEPQVVTPTPAAPVAAAEATEEAK